MSDKDKYAELLAAVGECIKIGGRIKDTGRCIYCGYDLYEDGITENTHSTDCAWHKLEQLYKEIVGK